MAPFKPLVDGAIGSLEARIDPPRYSAKTDVPGPCHMALSKTFAESVGFLMDDTYDAYRVFRKNQAIGTFFVTQAPSPGGNELAWMVTCRHVVEERTSALMGLMRTASNHLVRFGNPAPPWLFPDDASVDLAVAPFDPPPNTGVVFRAISIEQSWESFGPKQLPMAGLDVYFPGLLASPSTSSATRMGYPVVRSGTVAAVDQPNVTWTTSHGKRQERRTWRTPTFNTHLIDVRSFGGFSGSPCFVQYKLPGPKRDDQGWPEAWIESALRSGNDPEAIGQLHTFTVWWGMFAAHIGESGIGVVIPTSVITDILSSEKVSAIAEERDEHIRQQHSADSV